MDTFKTLIQWTIYSSKDAKKISLAVKGIGMIYAAYAMQALGLACQYGYQCEFDTTLLTDLVNLLADIVFYGLTLAGVLASVYGAARKVWRSLMGTNEVLQ